MQKSTNTRILTSMVTGVLWAVIMAPAMASDSDTGRASRGSIFTEIDSPKTQAILAYKAKDYDTAYRLFEATEPYNDPYSLFQLGLMNFLGEGTPKNNAKAKAYYQKSCDLQFTMACNAYENMLKKGL